MAIRSDGKIILAGIVQAAGGDRVGIARYTADGQPDDSLDGDGKLISGLGLGGTNVETSGVVADGDNIVVSGTLPGDGLQFVYDNPSYDSRLEVDTHSLLPAF